MHNHKDITAYIFLIIAPLFWSGNTIITKVISFSGTISPCCLAFMRWGVTFFFLLPFAWQKIGKDWLIIKESWKFILLLSILGFNPLPYIAIYTTTATSGALILSAMPVVVVVVSFVLYREKITLSQLLGVFVCLLGAIWIILKGSLFTIIKTNFALGDFIMAVETILYGIYSTILPRGPSIHTLSFLTLATGIATLGTLPFCFLNKIEEIRLTPEITLSILYMALFPSIVAYMCWNEGIKMIGANRTGLFINLIPIFTSIMAVFFLGESLETYHLVGITLIFSGIISFNYIFKKAPIN